MAKPDKNGFFGDFGGAFVPDTLMPALHELTHAYKTITKDPSYQTELQQYLRDYVGRPTPLYFAKRLSDVFGYKIYLKREDLCHTGAHKINNTIGQVLLAKRMGKRRIIAETGAGQHGVATATVCALMGMPCHIYMGEIDAKRQALNVARMRLLGAQVSTVNTGSKTLKDATTQAIRDWMTSVEDTHYIIGSALGPHPYPLMVRDFQSVIGKEAKKQLLKKEKKCPDHVLACIGGGSNALGIFHAFESEKDVKLLAAEAGGKGLHTPDHAASLSKGKPGILHGSKNYLCQDKEGQISPVHSISAGLDYPGVGPELSYLKHSGRVNVVAITDQEALEGCALLSKQEGIIPALESSHAIALLNKKKYFQKNDIILLNISGRGDKDMETIASYEL